MTHSPNEVAHEVLDVAPSIVRVIRTEMRRHRGADLSVPQFRTLAFLHHHPGASLSAAAEHLGLTLPTVSKMVDGLVARKLVTRATQDADRRCIRLAATPHGEATWMAARQSTQAKLAEQLAGLSEGERAAVVRAMGILRPIFAGSPEPKKRPEEAAR